MNGRTGLLLPSLGGCEAGNLLKPQAGDCAISLSTQRRLQRVFRLMHLLSICILKKKTIKIGEHQDKAWSVQEFSRWYFYLKRFQIHPGSEIIPLSLCQKLKTNHLESTKAGKTHLFQWTLSDLDPREASGFTTRKALQIGGAHVDSKNDYCVFGLTTHHLISSPQLLNGFYFPYFTWASCQRSQS